MHIIKWNTHTETVTKQTDLSVLFNYVKNNLVANYLETNSIQVLINNSNLMKKLEILTVLQIYLNK